MKNLVKIFVVVALSAALYSCESKENAANQTEAPADSVVAPAPVEEVTAPQPSEDSAAVDTATAE